MFTFCLFLMAIYSHSPYFGKLAIYLSLIGFTTYIIYASVYYDLGVMALMEQTKHNFNFGKNFYMKPWTRIPPFILGLLFGIYYREYYVEKKKGTSECMLSKLKLQFNRKWWLKWAFYVVGTLVVNLIIWLPKSYIVNGRQSWPTLVQNLWNAFVRFVYCFAVGLVCIPCMMGSKDFVVKILGSKAFTFLARITYCSYLVHYMCLQVQIMSLGQGQQWSYTISSALFVLGVVLAIIFASLMNLVIELPFMNLDGLLFNRAHAASRPPAKEPETQKLTEAMEEVKLTTIENAKLTEVKERPNERDLEQPQAASGYS